MPSVFASFDVEHQSFLRVHSTRFVIRQEDLRFHVSAWPQLLELPVLEGYRRRLNVNLPAYLALLSGILPDFDIYFQPYLVHHTYTHSLIVIIPVVLVLTYFFGRLGFAFS